MQFASGASVACLHVFVGSAGIRANSIVYAKNGVAPNYIPKASATAGDGYNYAGISDHDMLANTHDTVIVSGIVTVYSDLIGESPHTLVRKSHLRIETDDAVDHIIGVTVSFNVPSRLTSDGAASVPGIKVMLCPWMAACEYIDKRDVGTSLRNWVGPRVIDTLQASTGWSDVELGHVFNHIKTALGARPTEAGVITPCLMQ